MLLFVFLILPLLIWFVPFAQLKHRPAGARWFVTNFVAMLLTCIVTGLVLGLASDMQREAIAAIIIFISVFWAVIGFRVLKQF